MMSGANFSRKIISWWVYLSMAHKSSTTNTVGTGRDSPLSIR
jgi:hypothetical protein